MSAKFAKQIEAIKKAAAESLDEAGEQIVGTASPGDCVQQGDIHLVCIESLPAGTKTKRQLAPGNSQGSRHIAEGECSVYQPKEPAAVAQIVNSLCRGAMVPAELVGPIVECHGETTITHPEHRHFRLPAKTVWAVVYQRQYADEIRRVQD